MMANKLTGEVGDCFLDVGTASTPLVDIKIIIGTVTQPVIPQIKLTLNINPWQDIVEQIPLLCSRFYIEH